MRAMVLAVLVVLVAACTSPVPPAPPVVVPAPPAGLAERIDAFLAASRWGRYDHVADVLVTVRGRTVVEQHRRGPPDRRREIDGVTAAVLAALVGVVGEGGGLGEVRRPLAELLPEVPPGLTGATLHDLLVGGPVTPTDPLAELGPGLPAAPLAEVLSRATGRPLPELAGELLFAPLGIDPAWAGTAGPAVTAREMAVLGSLWLDRGLVAGRQVVPAAWMDTSARPYAQTGRRRLPYAGYRQWLAWAGGHSATVVTGTGGQLIEVVPALDLVVVVACDELDAPDPLVPPAGSETFVELVSSVIVPSVG